MAADEAAELPDDDDLSYIGTADLMALLEAVGHRCARLNAELEVAQASRLRLYLALEARDVAYSTLGVVAGTSRQAVTKALTRHHTRPDRQRRAEAAERIAATVDGL